MKIKEQSLYPDVISFLEKRLQILFPTWKVKAFDTSKFKLSGFLERSGMSDFFPGSDGFEIQVDVTGVLQRGNNKWLAFVECKCAPITLKDVGQILGYSRVALPVFALITSPSGISGQLNLLLTTYNRVDLLDYAPGKLIKIATWDIDRKHVRPDTVFPPGELG